MNNKLPENLRQLRSRQGITQKELARFLHRSPGSVSNYENGVNAPDYDTLLSLADFYSVSLDYLVGRPEKQCRDALLNRPIYGKYTLGRFLRLLEVLPEKRLALLTGFLRVLEENCRH